MKLRFSSGLVAASLLAVAVPVYACEGTRGAEIDALGTRYVRVALFDRFDGPVLSDDREGSGECSLTVESTPRSQRQHRDSLSPTCWESNGQRACGNGKESTCGRS